jgi:hypothetical protein
MLLAVFLFQFCDVHHFRTGRIAIKSEELRLKELEDRYNKILERQDSKRKSEIK